MLVMSTICQEEKNDSDDIYEYINNIERASTSKFKHRMP